MTAIVVGASLVYGSEARRNAIVRAVESARGSVVNIHGQKTLPDSYDEFGHAESPRRVNGMGTGVVIDPRGYIVTNHHVVQGVRRIQVTLDNGRTYIASLVAYDPRTDLAVIKINADRKLPVIEIGSSDDLLPGEDVIAVGNAYGYEHTVTRGIISSLHRTVQVSDTQQYEDLIQTDASINPGNSGGPLLNIDGEMIGVNVAVRAGAQGIGFAIPVSRVLDVTGDLLTSKVVDGNWHGLVFRPSSKSEGRAVVDRVVDGSPGAMGGFQRGDVILKLGSARVKRHLDVERALLGRRSGEEIDAIVERDGKQVPMSLVLATQSSKPRSVAQRAWDNLGVRLKPVSSIQRTQLSSRYNGGLVVTAVRDGSPAAQQRIRPGDILVGMHIWETVSMDNVAYVLSRPDLADLEPLKFYIVRNRETLFGHLTIARHSRTSRQ